MELVRIDGRPAFYREMARTAIAYKIARERPNAAIKIIEDITRARPPSGRPSYGWLAVTRARRTSAGQRPDRPGAGLDD